MNLHVVLRAPRIPQNAGQIARACYATGCRLHLVRPLGFRVDDPGLRRAAVGHLGAADLVVHDDDAAFWASVPDPDRAWLVTKHGAKDYAEAVRRGGDWLIFGNETEGLPAEWLAEHAERTATIPMANAEARCLNLATAASAVMFEALRQLRLRGGAGGAR